MELLFFIFPFLLSTVLTSAVLSVFGFPIVSVMTPVVVIVCLITFLLCYFTERHRVMGGIIITLYILLAFRLTRFFAMIGARNIGINFWEWVLTMGDEVGNDWYYVLGILTASAVFLSIIVYYFSIALYRISFLTLSSLLPCVLYIKVMAEVDNLYLVLIAGLNLAIHITRRFLSKREETVVGKKAFAVSAFTFCFIVLMFASVVPKDNDAIYYDKFEDLFLNGDTTTELSGDYSSLSEYSGNADNYKSISNRRMYTMYGTEYSYMKRQNFDVYNFDNDRWYSWYKLNDADENEYTPDEWKEANEFLQLSMLQNAIRRAANLNQEFEKKYNLEKITKGYLVMDSPERLYVRSENFGAMYYLAPQRVVGIDTIDTEEYYAVESGSFFRRNSVHPKNFSYNVSFYSRTAAEEWIALGGADFDDKAALEMLTELLGILVNNGDTNTKSVEAYINQQRKAYEYKELVSDNTENISDDIKLLANDITKDLKYDYEKADAIQSFFKDSGFIYDLEYSAEDDSPEFFLFESKTGTCSDYASAFVLLARAAGLTVRYAEGFMPEESSRQGYYYINESGSHAYPEVFIQNIGWLVYEPTVSNVAETTLMDYLKGLSPDYGLLFMIVSVGIMAGVIFGFAKFIIPKAAEVLFRIWIRITSSEKGTVSVYKRLVKKASRYGVKNAKSLTPNQFGDLLLERGCDISEFIIYLEKILYTADVYDTADDGNMYMKKNVRDSYKRAAKALKKRGA